MSRFCDEIGILGKSAAVQRVAEVGQLVLERPGDCLGVVRAGATSTQVDVMCQITDAKPVEVRGMGVRLSNEIAPDMYNYGHFQVLFEDGSLGWYEAGWGPMMSDTAFFVKDVVSPNGAVSIRMPESARSDDIDTHTKTSLLRVHRVGQGDADISMADEPGHQELCDREQAFVARAITEGLDLTRHMEDAVQSLAICLAADESVRSGLAVKL